MQRLGRGIGDTRRSCPTSDPLVSSLKNYFRGLISPVHKNQHFFKGMYP
jgi:hypothetical protein